MMTLALRILGKARKQGATLLEASRAQGGHSARTRFRVGAKVPEGFIDELEVGRGGQIHVIGWSGDADALELEVLVNGAPVPMREAFRLPRPDVAAALGKKDTLLGFSRRFSTEARQIGEVTVVSQGLEVARVRPDLPVRQPDYASLYEEREILHREQIYGSGPPTASANDDVLAMAIGLAGPVLDFGCGSGALVRALRQGGVDARGIELGRSEIESSLRDDVRPFVTLYDGAMPLPFGANEFATVVCSEVLEHIADFRTAVREIARVARQALITVPDSSAIPSLFPHFVVPWHLLESTHLNFFTQSSLHALLAEHFADIRFSRLGPFEVNGTRVYTSLVALCSR